MVAAVTAALDIVAQATLPTFPVLHATALPPLAPGDRRLLIARDGAYFEARSLVLHVCVPLAAFPTPYAAVDAFVRPIHGPLSENDWGVLCTAAMEACPTEMTRLVVADAEGYSVIAPPVSSASAGHVTYDDADVPEGHLVIDAHSHGRGAAFFSSTDDLSDLSRTGLHVSVVFGRCGAGDRLEVCARVCAGNYLIPIPPRLLGGR